MKIEVEAFVNHTATRLGLEHINQLGSLFDGVVLNVVKHHPRAQNGCTLLSGIYTDDISYHCEEMSASFNSMFELLMHWLTYKQLGLNESSLSQGLCRAIGLEKAC